MPEIKFSEKDIKQATHKTGLYKPLQESDLKQIHSTLLRHTYRLIKISFMEYSGGNEKEWNKFKEYLKRNL